MCIKHRPFKSSLLLKLKVVLAQSKEIDLSRWDISGEDMSQEDVSHLIIDDDDDIVDVEA